MRFIVLALALLPLPVLGGVPDVIAQQILPASAAFETATQEMREAAKSDCTAENLRPHFQRSFDAWMGLAHLGFGPMETDGRALTIAFWPDPRGIVARAVQGMLAKADPAVGDAAAFADRSIAARGLMAMERLLYDDDISDYASSDYACRYARAIAVDLAAIANDLHADWQAHGNLMLTAGAAENARYLAPREAEQELYTALLSGIAFDADQRLGRPMGSFERQRPKRAEAYRSDRPLRNLTLSLQSLRALASLLSDAPIPMTEAAFETAIASAEALSDSRLAGDGTPSGRLKLEILQQQIHAIGTAVEAEIGGSLGLTAGFNAKDGD